MESRQAESANNFESNQDRYFATWAAVGEIVLILLTGLHAALNSPLAATIGRRLGLLARASFVPDSGAGNNAANAFMLNMTPESFKHLASRRGTPKTKPGDENLYRFADITKAFAQPDDAENVAPVLRKNGSMRSARPKPKK